MFQIREADIPGVGRKYSLLTHNREKVVLIIHHDGNRELYFFPRDGEDPCGVLCLNDDEARQFGAIMAGAFFKPRAVESLEVALGELRIEWFTVGQDSPVRGQSIEDLRIRQRTGVSIIAIIRGSDSIPNPSPDVVFQAGDTIVVIGKQEGFADFKRLIRSG